MNIQSIALTLLWVLCSGMSSLSAQTPHLLNFQGRLTINNQGAQNTFDMIFSIYDVSTEGTPLWSETHADVRVENGIFNVLLGSVEPFPGTLFSISGDRFIGISLDGNPEMEPRLRLTSVAYAIRAAEADAVIDGAVTNADLAEDAVTSDKIADGEVVRSINALSDDINLVEGDNITITTEDNTITISAATVDLPDSSVTTEKLVDGAVTSEKILDRTIISEDIAPGGVEAANVADSQVVKSINTLTDDITIAQGENVSITESDNTLTISATGAELPDGSVTTTKLADDAVTSGKILDGTVVSVDLAPGAVESVNISDGQVVKSINSLRDDVTLAEGDNITITSNGNTLTLSSTASGVGDITAVNAGSGLSGGGDSLDVTLDVGAGTGISAAADQISLDAAFTDGRYVNEGQADAISTAMIQDDAVTAAKIQPNIVSSLDGVSNDAGNIDLVEGDNIIIAPDDETNSIAISAIAGGGTITAVNAGAGLTGGGTSDDVTLDVVAGTGMTVGADEISLDTGFTDGRYVNEGQADAIGTAMIQDDAVTVAEIQPNIVSSIDGVSNDGRNIDLVAGDNIDITPNDSANSITIAATGGGGDGHSLDAADGNPVDAVFVDDEGNVGIGTSNPTYRLDAVGNRIRLRSSTAAGAKEIMLRTDGAAVDIDANDADLFLKSNTGNTIIQGFGGSVGIGTTNPYTDLTLTGSIGFTNATTPMLYIFESGTLNSERPIISHSPNFQDWGLSYRDAGDKMIFQRAGTEVMTVDLATQQVGIGTSAPNEKLHVSSASQNIDAILAENTNDNGIALHVIGSSGGEFVTGLAGLIEGDVKIEGDLDVTGVLSKTFGSFKIDHPLDPENKYLYHSFVESPDMMNVYNGNVILDENGKAVVELPDWFEGLNKDFRYQLTCIGGFAQVYISEEISNNRFKIAGGEPGLKVSWQVTGIRNDPVAQQNRIPVEKEKRIQDRGKYLHPKVYGLPKQMGIQYKEPQTARERD